MRKKLARLEAIAPVSHGRVVGREPLERALEAFHAQRRARTQALGVLDPYASAAARDFLGRLAHEGVLELHALNHGERIIAVFGALAGANRLCGLFIAHDGDPEIARSSPGELMVHAIVADAIARGLAEFDLGVGEARYKDESCELVEPLFDSAFAVSLRGWLAARAFLAARRAKRFVKQSPTLRALLERLGEPAQPATEPSRDLPDRNGFAAPQADDDQRIRRRARAAPRRALFPAASTALRSPARRRRRAPRAPPASASRRRA